MKITIVGAAGGEVTGSAYYVQTRQASALVDCGLLQGGKKAATLIQCRKIGPFPVILMGSKFWAGLRRWGRFMMKQGVYTKDELKFGHVTDSPREAVQIILRSLPPAVRKKLKPLPVTRGDGFDQSKTKFQSQ